MTAPLLTLLWAALRSTASGPDRTSAHAWEAPTPAAPATESLGVMQAAIAALARTTGRTAPRPLHRDPGPYPSGAWSDRAGLQDGHDPRTPRPDRPAAHASRSPMLRC